MCGSAMNAHKHLQNHHCKQHGFSSPKFPVLCAATPSYSPHRNKAEKTHKPHKALTDNMTKYMQLSCKGALHTCSQSFADGGIY
jgi:hypothetical protein